MESALEDLLQNGPVIVNIGVREFAESAQAQEAEVVHVDWTPPAGGDKDMEDLLDKLL
jgi:FdrA protein